ncbi:MAG: FkbM family methyltransferase [Methylocystis sp.]|uniref:FkbM family methyltransferase n=1 Tax=Methylocystis sp. TaxID=1911079 RepID=UPI003DA2461C
MQSEIHPPLFGYRLARYFRGLRNVPGWGRITNYLAPPDHDGTFVVDNDGIKLAGNVRSFLDRQVYLFGHYEGDLIALFLSMIGSDRRRVILDVGANIGTHSLAFSKNFQHVHSFEPNPAVCAQFKRNVFINKATNITLHEFGLGSVSEDMPFFSIDKANYGLGTFLASDQYDLPLQQIGTLRVENGDAFVASAGISQIDAIKIDVQGLEPEVLAGLSQSIRRYRPIIWFEYGGGTKSFGDVLSLAGKLIPYPVNILRIYHGRSGFMRTAKCEPVDETNSSERGDYVLIPYEG